MKPIRLASSSIAVLGLAALLLAACSGLGRPARARSGGDQLVAASTRTSATQAFEVPAGVSASRGSAVPNASSIPPGRSFSEGGAGSKSYTFREEWRRALSVAEVWRSGAYLITASGRNVNDDGVPSTWSMKFVDAIPTDEVLMLDIDPWGTVTQKHLAKTSVITDLVQPGDGRIPLGIMDSDAAVAKCKQALAAAQRPVTGNADLGLAFVRDGSGPFWSYVAEGPDSRYFIAGVNAVTGETRVADK